ncbi:hypothetical protein BT96DRAFT_1008040 [Gymnopus androsaceus JB14]|uniref:DUF6532 domain-containing protein n=1 Tax=Gymnopus androsaceus JB14 TaxID=1447944 RepID=A0A6A4GGH4_9AGAR|nr:hypothetical protein BT96DRAFT_1008040 [Gymnopus androsaceus JB14]
MSTTGTRLTKSRGNAAAPALSTRSKANKQPTSKAPARARKTAAPPLLSSLPHSSSPVEPHTSINNDALLWQLTKKKSNQKKKDDECCCRDIQERARKLQAVDDEEDYTAEGPDWENEDQLPPTDNGANKDGEEDSDLEQFNETFGPSVEDGADEDIDEDMFNNGTTSLGGDDNDNNDAIDIDDDGPDNAECGQNFFFFFVLSFLTLFPKIDIDSSPVPATPSKKPKRGVAEAQCRMSLAMSPSRAHSSHVTSSPAAIHHYKITRSNFTPRTRRYAEAAKKGACHAATMENAFPEDKHSFFLAVAQKQALKDPLTSSEFLATLTRLLSDLEVQKWFTTYMGYGCGGLFTALIGCARKWVAGFYNLPGKRTSTQVQTLVAWLLKEGHFKYGDVDIENFTFDKKHPFANQGIAHILRLEIFAAKDIVSAKTISAPTVALILTVYSEGSCHFSEFSDAARPWYLYHLSSYHKIAMACPIWGESFRPELFTLLLSQSNKSFLLDVEANDMGDIDLEGLEADAIAKKAAVNSIQVSAAGSQAASQPTAIPATTTGSAAAPATA